MKREEHLVLTQPLTLHSAFVTAHSFHSVFCICLPLYSLSVFLYIVSLFLGIVCISFPLYSVSLLLLYAAFLLFCIHCASLLYCVFILSIRVPLVFVFGIFIFSFHNPFPNPFLLSFPPQVSILSPSRPHFKSHLIPASQFLPFSFSSLIFLPFLHNR